MTKKGEHPNALISVIVPAYNCEKYLAEAIHSIEAQDYRPLEIIIANDGSTDATETVARSFIPGVRYYHQENSGTGAARNFGVRKAKGKFLAFLDADDLWMPGKLSLQMETLSRSPELDIVFGCVEQFVSPELKNTPYSKRLHPGKIMTGQHAGAMLIKHQSFKQVGFFPEKMRIGEFIDWFSLAMEKGLKTYTLPEVVMRRRMHSTNTVLREQNVRQQYLSVMKAIIDRRRLEK